MVRTYRKTDIDVKWYSVVQPLITIGLAGVLSLLLYTTVDQGTLTVQAREHDSVTGMIARVFGPNAAAALRVARCESGLNPTAVNGRSVRGSHSAGLFQILYPSTWRSTSQAGRSPYNAWANILAAHEIFVRDGHSWRQWVCKP